MKKLIFTAAAAVIMASATMPSAAAEFGYTAGVLSRDNVFRMGSTAKQGAAMRLPKEKLVMLKGHSISGIKAAFGSRNTSDGNAQLFIATSLTGEPIYKESGKITSIATKWNEYTLATPYVITGEEPELFIGYTLEGQSEALKMLSADFTADSKGQSFVYTDGEWIDLCGQGFGAVNIRAVINDVPDFTDLVVKDLAYSGYFKAENEYTFTGQVLNFGTQPITSYEIELSLEGSNPQTFSFDNVNIAPGAVADFTLPNYSATAPGKVNMEVKATAVNGGADKDASDNLANVGMFFYPADMERNILFEGFTGQACGNCPRGHQQEHNFMASIQGDPVIEVMHHIGYQPDFFTMAEQSSYLFFYGDGGSFAPAFMMNRAIYPSIDFRPAMNVSDQALALAYTLAHDKQPYVKLALNTDFNHDTKEVTVQLDITNINDLPADQNVFNLLLLQDSIIGYQSGAGAAYIHNRVSRGSLTNNAWGILVPNTKAGEVTTWTNTFTLPDSIYSDYDKTNNPMYNIGTVPEHMSIVAYVGSYSTTSYAQHLVYNCVSAKLGDSVEQKGDMSSVSNVTIAAKEVSISVVGRSIEVEGEYTSLQAYTLSGQAVNPAELPGAGVYVVRVQSPSGITVKKFYVK